MRAKRCGMGMSMMRKSNGGASNRIWWGLSGVSIGDWTPSFFVLATIAGLTRESLHAARCAFNAPARIRLTG